MYFLSPQHNTQLPQLHFFEVPFFQTYVHPFCEHLYFLQK